MKLCLLVISLIMLLSTLVIAQQPLPLEKPDTPVVPSTPVSGTVVFIKDCVKNIEGCQYVVRAIGNTEIYIHKGNCTNCWARLKNLIEMRHCILVNTIPNTYTNNYVTNFCKTFNMNGCQYAFCWGNSIAYTHIGSCTNCWTRMEKLIDQKLEEVKTIQRLTYKKLDIKN